jgi:hypothetical protein
LLVLFRLVIDESFGSRRCAKTTPAASRSRVDSVRTTASVLPDGLNAVSDAIQDSKDEDERYELVREVFEEIRRRSIVCGRWRNSTKR